MEGIIEIAPENPLRACPVLTGWMGMKGASADSRRKANQMLKQVQHDT
jgi:hypothetical protein